MRLRFASAPAAPRCTIALLAALWWAGAPARADDTRPDKSPYGLLAPTPDTALRAFSPDRPLNAVSPFTVDAGRFQIESDFLLYSHAGDGTTTTRFVEGLDPMIRLGLTQSFELAIQTPGLFSDRTTLDRTGRTLSRDTGAGSVTLRGKLNLLGNDGGDVAFAVLPFLVLPSGNRTFGDPDLDGGILAPLNLTLPRDFDLVLESGVQTAHDTAGGAYASFTNIVNLTHPIPGIDKLSGSIEFTSIVNADRSTPDIYTFDAALTYLVTPVTQLDIGTFIGLDRAAPDYQVSAGIAHRF